MEKIKVNKTELLSILESNRSKHRQIFEEACDGYQKAVIKELEAQLKRAKEGIRRSMLISIPAPVDQTREYDRAIAMLKMSVEEEVFLSEQDFRCYVLDDWDWKQKFLASSRNYSAPRCFATGRYREVGVTSCSNQQLAHSRRVAASRMTPSVCY